MARKSVYDMLMIADEPVINSATGDFFIGESTAQHQEHLLLAEPGVYKQFPLVGAGLVEELLNDNADTNVMKSKIQREFEADGMAIDYLNIKQSKLLVNAGYKF